MNTLNRSNLGVVQGIIREIEEKSLDGDYIYRGERKHYKHVSSSLYREYKKLANDLGEAFEIGYIQEELLEEAKRHITHLVDKGQLQIRAHQALAASLGVQPTLFIESNEDVKILSEVQHYGGKTNLIDFTTDYLIALFFACDGSPRKPGRVILLNQDKVPDEKIIVAPQHPRDRVIAQKSVFIRPPEGFIDPENEDYADTVCIPACRKGIILEYLRQFHGIESPTVYNDLHGFVINQGIHQEASKEFCRGLAWQMRADKGQLYTEDGKLLLVRPDGGQLYTEDGKLSSAARQGYEKAIKHYTQAIGRKPDYLRAYDNRSSAYRRIGEYEDAIEDCNVALSLLNPHQDKTYFHLGMAQLHLGKCDEAKANLETAKKEGGQIADWFKAENYGSIATFKKILGTSLREDIENLLTGRDADIDDSLPEVLRNLLTGRDADIDDSLPEVLRNLLTDHDSE